MSRPTSSISSIGPMGMPNSSASLSMRSGARPKSTRRRASSKYGPKIRLTKNPGTSATTTGVLPNCSASLAVRRTVRSLVCLPRTISTKGMACTGLKKCMPTTRSGCGNPWAMASTDSDDVLVARIASSRNCAASAPSTLRLTSKRSGSRIACLSIVFKLAHTAERKWRKLDRHLLLGDILQVIKFKDGTKVAA